MTSLTNYVWCLTVIVTLQSVGKLCIEHVYCKSMKDDNLNASYSTFSTHGSGSHCHYCVSNRIPMTNIHVWIYWLNFMVATHEVISMFVPVSVIYQVNRKKIPPYDFC